MVVELKPEGVGGQGLIGLCRRAGASDGDIKRSRLGNNTGEARKSQTSQRCILATLSQSELSPFYTRGNRPSLNFHSQQQKNSIQRTALFQIPLRYLFTVPIYFLEQ